MKAIPITLRLLLSYLVVAVLPLLGISIWYVSVYESSLNTTMQENMNDIADKKADQIEVFLAERLTGAAQINHSELTRKALAAFGKAYQAGGLDSAAYRAAERKLSDDLKEHATSLGYWDLLLIDRDGNVVFSVAREDDLGTNLRTGPYRDTELARGFDLAMHSLQLHLTRFAPYAPSAQRAAAFVVSPIRENDKTVGALALQLNLDRLDAVVQDRTGLGISGETVLAQLDGDQVLFTEPLRHVPDAAFRHLLPLGEAALPLRQSLAGIAGHAMTKDYAGVDVVAAWRYLPSLRWGMVAKIDTEEALASAVRLRRLTYAVLMLFLVLSGVPAYWLGRRLTRPIIDLAEAAEGIAHGDLTRRAQTGGFAELGRMEESFNTMADKLADARKGLETQVVARTTELQLQTARLVEAQHTARIGNWELDLVSGTLFWSGEIFNIFEIDPARFSASYEGFISAIHPEDRERVNRAYTDSLANRAPYEIEHRLLMPDGQVKWVSERCQTYYDEQGKSLRSTGTVQDITKQKKVELEQARFSAIVASSDDAIMSKTLDGIITSWNPAAERIFGYSKQEAIGQPMVMLIPPDRVHEEAEILSRIGCGENVDHFETVRVRKDGSPIFISATISPLRDGTGKIVGASKIARDITKAKQAEIALVEAKQAAEAASRTKSEFLANMSHEIRTPMNAILGLTRLVLDSELKPQQENYLRKVVTSSRSLMGILNDILDYSKIEAGHMKIEHVPLRIEEILRDMADLFSAHLEEKGLEIFFDIGQEVPIEILGDPLRLAQVLNNLVGNATKFTEHGEIHIKVAAEPDGDELLLHFSVRDTGIGFDDQLAESLFQPFVQADSSVTRKFGGTGLGLSICHKLVTLMGGEITASGIAGVGATFSFSIRAGRSTTATTAPDLQQLTGLKVLVVDDQETSRLILRQLLEAWRLEVQTTASGAEALYSIREAVLANRPFDMVLLDWRMPGMSGLEVARQLEQATGQGVAPMLMVMITMHDREALLAEAGSLRLDGVLTKPVVPSHLFDILVNRRNLPVRALATESAVSSTAVRFDGARILLVEDNALNQEVAAAFLERRGATVVLANNGAEALERVQGQPFDAVLMDLHMPGMDGIEATRRICAMPEIQDLPIIAMTAAVLQEDRERCTAAGMVDFVAKPVDPEELSLCLKKWLHAYVRRTPVSAAERAAPELPELPGFDLAAALHRLDGDLSRLTRLLRGYAEERRDALLQLDALLQAQAGAATADLLHALRGAAANLGATDLAVVARQLEQEIRAGEELHSRAAFASALEAALAAIAHAFPEPEAETDVLAETDLRALAELLKALVPYLQEGELIPDELTQSLRQFSLQDLPKNPLRKLIRNIDHFNHEGALSDIMQLAAILNLEINT